MAVAVEGAGVAQVVQAVHEHHQEGANGQECRGGAPFNFEGAQQNALKAGCRREVVFAITFLKCPVSWPDQVHHALSSKANAERVNNGIIQLTRNDSPTIALLEVALRLNPHNIGESLNQFDFCY